MILYGLENHGGGFWAPGRIAIQYDAVYAKTAKLRGLLDSQYSEMEAKYKQLHLRLEGMDGLTNHTLAEAMRQNLIKAQVSCEALQKLLEFMELSAVQVELDEIALKGTYTMASNGGTLSQGGAD